jgi:hypothetical protein
MSGAAEVPKAERPALPRDTFRHQRAASTSPMPVVVTPDYSELKGSTAVVGPDRFGSEREQAVAPRLRPKAKSVSPRNPFEGYGERTSSRPYALRLPDAIDLVLRQMAAEERTQPLRVIDRILYEHLKRSGRLPPPDRT